MKFLSKDFYVSLIKYQIITEMCFKSKCFYIYMKEINIFSHVLIYFGSIHSKSGTNRDFNWTSQAQNFLVGRHFCYSIGLIFFGMPAFSTFLLQIRHNHEPKHNISMMEKLSEKFFNYKIYVFDPGFILSQFSYANRLPSPGPVPRVKKIQINFIFVST
jgi:hypothetical protein